MITDKQRLWLPRLMAFFAAFTVLFWILWFGDRSLLASNTRPAYYEFENAFPAADGWLAFAWAIAAFTLRKARPSALLWLIASGSAAIYLAGMDILYDLEHAIWWRSGAGGMIEALINLVSIGSGVYLITWSWARKEVLLSRSE